MRTRTFARLAAVGLATSMLAAAGASAQPATEGPVIAAGGGPGVTVQDLRAYPDQVGGGVQAAPQELRWPDQVGADTPSATTPAGAPQPAHPQALRPTPQATSSSSSSSDDGIDSGWFIGAGGLALASLTGLGVVYLIRVRTARQRAAA